MAFREEIFLRPLSVEQTASHSMKAEMLNIGDGGVCVTSSEQLVLGGVVRCEFKIGHGGALVPALLQVRWIEQVSPLQYRCGLMHLV